MRKSIFFLLFILTASSLFTSCMFFPKSPHPRSAGKTNITTESAEDLLDSIEMDDDEISVSQVTSCASITEGSEANAFGVYPTYIICKVHPAYASTATVTIHRRLNKDYDPELIVDAAPATTGIFEDANESARVFQTYEYQVTVHGKNGNLLDESDWMTGYGAITPERLFFAMSIEAEQGLHDLGLPSVKMSDDTKPGKISGSVSYHLEMFDFNAFVTYKNYRSFNPITLNGEQNTHSYDTSGNSGYMWGTITITGMYQGTANYDKVTIKNKNAGGGYYQVSVPGLTRNLPYNITDKAPTKTDVIRLDIAEQAEPAAGDEPSSLGVYPVHITCSVDEDSAAGATLVINRREAGSAARTIYRGDVVETFTDTSDDRTPQTVYQYKAELYKGSTLLGVTRWYNGAGALIPATLSVTASQEVIPEGYEANTYGIYPVAVHFEATEIPDLFRNATYVLVRRPAGSEDGGQVIHTVTDTVADFVDENPDALFGQKFEYRIMVLNEDGQVLRYSDWATGWGACTPIQMSLSVSDNADRLSELQPNGYGAYPVTLTYSLSSIDPSLTELSFTIVRKSGDTGVTEELFSEPLEESAGTYTDCTADARRLSSRNWLYAVELKSEGKLYYRTDWVAVEPVLVPATLSIRASDGKDADTAMADRFGLMPVILEWHWESDVAFLAEGSYVKLYYKTADDQNGTQVKDAPTDLSGSWAMPVTSQVYQYKADLVRPNGKKTAVVATTGWTEPVQPYQLSYGFEPLTVSNNQDNLTMEPNRYGINPLTVSWKWNAEKPFLKDGSYITLTSRSKNLEETVLISKEDSCCDTELTYTDRIPEVKRVGNRTFSYKVDLYTAQDELISTTGWSSETTGWIVPVNCTMTASKARVSEHMPEANSHGTYPVYLDFSMNDFYYTHSLVTIQRRIKNGEGVYTEFVLNLDNENHGMYESDYADTEPTVIYQYRATVKSLDGVTMKETDWVDGYGAVAPDVFFTEWLETLDAGLSKTTNLWKDSFKLSFPNGKGNKNGTVVYKTTLGYTDPKVEFSKYQDTDVILNGTFGFTGNFQGPYHASNSTVSVSNARSGFNGKIGFTGMWYEKEVDRPEGNYTAIIGEFTQQYTQDGQLVYTAD